jgi:hypothetical protein
LNEILLLCDVALLAVALELGSAISTSIDRIHRRSLRGPQGDDDDSQLTGNQTSMVGLSKLLSIHPERVLKSKFSLLAISPTALFQQPRAGRDFIRGPRASVSYRTPRCQMPTGRFRAARLRRRF